MRDGEVVLFFPLHNAESEISLQVIDPTSEQLSYIVRELVPYTDYIIRVSAFTIVGEGPPSSIPLKTQQYGMLLSKP